MYVGVVVVVVLFDDVFICLLKGMELFFNAFDVRLLSFFEGLKFFRNLVVMLRQGVVYHISHCRSSDSAEIFG